MQRKKVSTGTNNAAAVLELDDDEQLIETVTTTKAIGRQRRPKPAEIEPEPIIGEIEDDDDDDQDTDDRPSYSDTSLAALLYGDGDEPLESQFCTVMIRRNPDSMNDRFLNPCGSLSNLAPMRNIELTAERMDIEERVRSEYGGGHYFFQLHFDNRLRSSWKATLADDPAAIRTAKADAAPQPIASTAAAAAAPLADPMDSFIASLKQTAELKSLLFGDTESRMQAEIDRLRAEAETARNATPPEPLSEEILLWKMAKEMPESEAKNRLLDKLVPVDEAGNRHWIADVAAVVMENKDTILGLVGSLFGGAAQPAASQPNVMDMLRQPAPAALPQHRSAFSRTKPPADPAPAETPPPAGSGPAVTLAGFDENTPPPDYVSETVIDGRDLTKGDETAIDAEITSEVKDAKPKRKRDAAA